MGGAIPASGRSSASGLCERLITAGWIKLRPTVVPAPLAFDET